MKSMIDKGAAFILVLAFMTTPVWATCGGGGGGGGGGMSSNNGNGGGGTENAVVYHVPWKIVKDGDKPITEGMVLYWFPASKNELQNSSLRESRNLSLYASQCVTMQLADGRYANADKLIGDSKLPVAVLADPDGTPLQKLENTGGKLKVTDVEKLVGGEIKTRGRKPGQELRTQRQRPTAATNRARPALQDSCGREMHVPEKGQDRDRRAEKTWRIEHRNGHR